MRMSILHVVLSLYIAIAVLVDMPSIATRNESWLVWYLIFYVLWDCVFCISKLSQSKRGDQADQCHGGPAHAVLPTAVSHLSERLPRLADWHVRHSDLV